MNQETNSKISGYKLTGRQITNARKIVHAIEVWADNDSRVTKRMDNRKNMVFAYYNSRLALGDNLAEAIDATKDLNSNFSKPLTNEMFKTAVTTNDNIYVYSPDGIIALLKPTTEEIELSGLYTARKERVKQEKKAEENDVLYLELMKNIIRIYNDISTIPNVIYNYLPDHIKKKYTKKQVKKILKENGFCEVGKHPELHAGMLMRYGHAPQIKTVYTYPFQSSSARNKELYDLYMEHLENRNKMTEYGPDTPYKEAIQLLFEGNEDMLILGGAGAGKTRMINDFFAKYKEERERTLIVAPTAKAASAYEDGYTIHSSLSFNLQRRAYHASETSPIPKILFDKKIMRIIIDEIGMVRVDVMEQMLKIIKQLRESGRHIQLICMGDFAQIRPVVTDADRKVIDEYEGIYALHAPSWKVNDFRIISLYCCFRLKDNNEITKTYREAVYGIKYGQYYGINWINSNISHKEDWRGIFLCGTHETSDYYNDRYIMQRRFLDNLKLYKATIMGRWDKRERPAKEKLFLAPGMRVMTTRNADDYAYKNGSFGRITKLEDNGVWVCLDKSKKEVFVERYIFHGEYNDTYEQLPIAVAKAITIHAAQGETFDGIVNVAGPFFEYGQLYVALTRIRDVKNLRIIGCLKPEDVMADPDAVKWAT